MDNKTPPIVVIVDDEVDILNSLRRALARQKYQVSIFLDPFEAIDFITKNRVHVVISDMRMPLMMGQDFLAKVNQIQPSAYRIVLTGYADIEATLDVVNRGGISAFLQKPWDTEALLRVVQQGVEHTQLIFENEWLQEEIQLKNKLLQEANANLEEKVMRRTKQIRATLIKLEQTYSANLNVLFNVLSSHPSIDGEFAKKIAKMAKKIAAILNPESEFVESVGLAGMLCELGFIGLDEDLVDTPYTLMNAAQLKQFKQQGNIASLILAPASHLANVAQMLREQYRPFIPLLDESEPCLGAQILAVVRDYQRILDGRYFSEAMPEKRAMAELVKHKGNRYSSTIIDLILEQPNLLDTKAKESTLTIDQLEPGMILLEDLLTESNILLLPEGHVFNQRTITRIRQFQNTIPGKLSLSVSNPLENEN